MEKLVKNLVESLKDPLVVSQLVVNTAGNLSTLGLEIAKIQKNGLKDRELSIVGTAIGFIGWGLLLADASKNAPKQKTVKATCIMTPNGKEISSFNSNKNMVTGTVTLEQASENEPCIIKYKIRGLKPGLHGFHVHETADFSNGCNSTGGHYNPFGKLHGGPDDIERHVGDLGNILADKNGVSEGIIRDRLVKLSGKYSVIGRSLVLHADPDDLGRGGNQGSKTTGNAGARLSCGEIKIV